MKRTSGKGKKKIIVMQDMDNYEYKHFKLDIPKTFTRQSQTDGRTLQKMPGRMATALAGLYSKIAWTNKLLFSIYLAGDFLCNIFTCFVAYLFITELTENGSGLQIVRHICYIVMPMALYLLLYILISELFHASAREITVIEICGSTWRDAKNGIFRLLIFYHGILTFFAFTIFIAATNGCTTTEGFCMMIGIIVQVIFYFILYCILSEKE